MYCTRYHIHSCLFLSFLSFYWSPAETTPLFIVLSKKRWCRVATGPPPWEVTLFYYANFPLFFAFKQALIIAIFSLIVQWITSLYTQVVSTYWLMDHNYSSSLRFGALQGICFAFFFFAFFFATYSRHRSNSMCECMCVKSTSCRIIRT